MTKNKTWGKALKQLVWLQTKINTNNRNNRAKRYCSAIIPGVPLKIALSRARLTSLANQRQRQIIFDIRALWCTADGSCKPTSDGKVISSSDQWLDGDFGWSTIFHALPLKIDCHLPISGRSVSLVAAQTPNMPYEAQERNQSIHHLFRSRGKCWQKYLLSPTVVFREPNERDFTCNSEGKLHSRNTTGWFCDIGRAATKVNALPPTSCIKCSRQFLHFGRWRIAISEDDELLPRKRCVQELRLSVVSGSSSKGGEMLERPVVKWSVSAAHIIHWFEDRHGCHSDGK